MDCPAGALENMEKLGLKRGDKGLFEFESHQGSVGLMPVKEGWTSFRPVNVLVTKPFIKRLSGKLLFGGGRVYGRLTQATLSDGATLRVCIELVGYNHFNEDLSVEGPLEPGLPCLPTSSADTVKVGSTVDVRVVDHFE
jgi:serine/threonine-protein kinase